MPEIEHVVVKVERDRTNSTSATLVAEAGYPDEDDVVTAIEYGPIDVSPTDPEPVIDAADLDATLEGLSEALSEEAGLDVPPSALRARLVVVYEPLTGR